ncbi:hypothetical protein [Caulobacter sp. 1776]|uniref:hypothetical protein n=1 Tax=Caulobacter sp. 1776 TaxID=3156420 RepID=UPI003396734C
MVTTAKCPHCEKTAISLIVKTNKAHSFSDLNVAPVTFECPSCHAILGVIADPRQTALITKDALSKRS